MQWSVMPPPPTAPPSSLELSTVGPSTQLIPTPPAVNNLFGPSLPSPLPAIAINFSGPSSNPAVSAVSSSSSPLCPSVGGPMADVAAARSQPVLTLSAVAAVVSGDARKAEQWKALTDKFDETRMRKHDWSYDTDYMPFYRFQQVSQICDVWTEWSTGLNGFLPVRNLNEGWGARWRQGNRGQGTENCRRSRLVELVEKLIAKPG